MFIKFVSGIQSKIFSELRFEPVNLIIKAIVKTVSHHLEGFLAWTTVVQLVFFFCSRFSASSLAPRDFHRRAGYRICEFLF